ncbi:hypothetical protein [Mycobacteroides abscessus]|uniref:hypothetical protein n=1 Tax=Mycobacteroides abscessus TaxID=36809 RepID=UPI000C26926C|nr:hypothetical protein [Mycobacteroides abscessus]RIS68908.1 hypothetical protein D2E70_17560 [Mycobacteroides abscessus]
MWEFLVLLLIGGSLALLIMQMRRGRQAQPGMNAVQGTLLVTGVSPRPEGVTGEQLVTITGALNGPTVAEYITYRQIVRDVNDWPRIGDLIPVLYPLKNPDRWNILLAPLPGPTPQQYPSGPPPMENIDPSPPPPPPPPGPVEGPPSTGDPAKKHEPPPRYYEPPPL